MSVAASKGGFWVLEQATLLLLKTSDQLAKNA